MCQIDLVHLMSYIVYWYEPSDLAYEISHLIWHMRFTAIWGNRSTVDPIVLPKGQEMQVHRDGCLEGGEGAGLRGGADRVHRGGDHRLH